MESRRKDIERRADPLPPQGMPNQMSDMQESKRQCVGGAGYDRREAFDLRHIRSAVTNASRE